MMKIGKCYFFRDHQICPNYGGWVLLNDFGLGDWNIYKTLEDAKNAYRKGKDGTHKAEPRTIGRMTDEQFINALNI